MNNLDKELYLARNAFNEASRRLNNAVDASSRSKAKRGIKARYRGL